jgi:hypothetical protein
MSEYHKYCYWVDFQGLQTIREHLGQSGIELREETRLPCRVLRESMEAGSVLPEAWSGFCKRRTSWYLSSDKAAKFLVVSKEKMNLSGLENPILIMSCNFKPERLPTSGEILALGGSRSFREKMPRSWKTRDPLEEGYYRRLFERYAVGEPLDFETILLSHSANHANFIEPEFFENLNGRKVPYSIADSLHVCSSCLELFDIVGSQWPLKYVVPCIGAVQFAKLAADRYFRVEAFEKT